MGTSTEARMKTMASDQCFPSAVSKPAASASSRYLLEMPILRSHPRPSKLETLEVRQSVFVPVF